MRRRRIELRRSIRQLAADLGVSGGVITALEAGTNHKDLSVGFLTRLAEALGVDPTTLLPPGDTDTAAEAGPGDAATLGAVVHASEVLTAVDTIAEILDWPLDRVHAALDELAATLPQAGLRLHRLGRKVSIQRSVEALDADRVRSTVRAHLANENLDITEARVLARVRDGNLGKELGNADQVALSVLVSAGLITAPGDASNGRQGPWELSDDVRYSLLLHEF